MNSLWQNFIQDLRGTIGAGCATTSPSAWNSLLGAGLMVALLAQAGGCSISGSEKIMPPMVDPGQAADKALEHI